MKNYSTQKKRILQFLDYKGLSKNKFYIETGISNGTLDKTSGLSMDSVEKFYSKYKEVNPEWLLTGEGEMLKKLNIKDPNESILSKGIPLIPVEAFAGNGGGDVSIKEGDIQDRYVIPDFVDVDFMIRVQGSSMYPKYNSGDIIACKIIKERSFFQWGRVFVIHHREQGTMIKRLFPANDEEVECKSDNPGYPPFKISLEEITNIALVKGVVRLE